MSGMDQVKHAVGEHHRAGQAGAPGEGLVQRPDLSGTAAHVEVAFVADDPNSSFKPGGATKVVAMIMSKTAPNTASLRIPARRPMSAKMSPTSPRGTIPTPTTIRRKLSQGAAQPAASFPMIASTVSVPATANKPKAPSRVGSSSLKFTDAPTLTKKIGAKMEATGRTSCSMVSNWLVPERM